jgi:hypothetical protein
MEKGSDQPTPFGAKINVAGVYPGPPVWAGAAMIGGWLSPEKGLSRNRKND